MTLYECDFCGKRFVNENEMKKLSMMLGDLTFKTKDICPECSRCLDKAITDVKMQRLKDVKEEAIKGKSTDYGESFRVVDMGDGEILVTRSDSFPKDGRKLKRSDIYAGRWEEAASEYAHAFMCGGFPTNQDPKRPPETEWMAEEPYPHEVDRYITDKMFPRGLPHGGTDNEAQNRCWQMNRLRDCDDTQPKYDAIRKALCVVKDAFDTDVIWAPGASPTYEQVEKVRKVYKAVCDALGKNGVKKAKLVSKS